MILKSKYNFRISGMIILIPLLVLSFSKPAFTQKPTLEWVTDYISTVHDNNQLFDMALDSNGNVYMLGREGHTVTLLKVNPSGVIEWTRQYHSQSQALVKNVFIDRSGNINIYFIINSLFFTKYNPAGDSIGGNVIPVFFDGDYYRTPNAKINERGEIYVGGSLVNFANWSREYIILKLDSSFNLLWEHRTQLQIETIGSITGLDFDSNGNVYFSGNDILVTGGIYKIFLYKLNPDGQFIWRSDFDITGFNHMNGRSLIIDRGTNEIYINGSCQYGTEQNDKSIIVKYDSSGNMLWYDYYPELGVNHSYKPTGLKFDHDGNIIVGGHVNIYPNFSENFLILKYSPIEGLIWSKLYMNEFSTDYLRDFYIDNSNNIYCTGWQIKEPGYTSVYSVKTDSGGNMEWETWFKHSDDGSDDGEKILVDKFQNVFVGGIGRIIPKQSDIFVLKYSQLVSVNPGVEIIENFKLYQNYPNPFNGQTKVKFQLPKFQEKVDIIVYDVSGKELMKITHYHKEAGAYELDLNFSSYSTGAYFLKFTAGEFSDTKKLLLIK